MTPPNEPRNARIMRLHATGKLSAQAIADRLAKEGFGEISRQAVRVIVQREKAKT